MTQGPTGVPGPSGPRPGARYLPPPPYPPGQPPLEPRRREPRHSPIIAPLLAFLGLILIGGASLWGFTFLNQGADDGPVTGAAPNPGVDEPTAAPASGDPVVEPTPVPEPDPPTLEPEVVVAPAGERPDIKGSILFSRGGDIWSASGATLRKLSGGNSDTAPTWSHNGKRIYFVRTNKRTTNKTRGGGLYTFFVPDIWRMDADGSNKKRIYNSFINNAAGQWFSHVLQPDISPDGKTLAVVSDGPNGSGVGNTAGVTLYLLNSRANSRLRKVSASSELRLGHNDPEWSPDGKRIAYTRNRTSGGKGVPSVAIHSCKSKKDCTSGKSRKLRPGYANPSWSPDGRWLAVESTKGEGRDIAIVNARRGDPRIVLTNDGNSFAPVVSPDGDQIAYLHRDGLDIDLRVMTLDIDDSSKITLVDDQAVTTDGAIDAESPPAWYIPKSELTQRDQPDPLAPGTVAATDAP